MNKGSELDKQIYKEGDNTWGCKDGWLDVEDVREFIKKLKEDINSNLETHVRYGKSTTETEMRFSDILRDLDRRAGKKFTPVASTVTKGEKTAG